ncbi:unnamed protein product [Ambrosiozyma monospora]|uniref:RNA helicase n=1 Tax=Ambrosiozyma monospora TaxID=43982 RepID=A0A9W7DDW1_AMBMO|nr:unnamed protein product [Ambrosiozyma monospora]
MVSVAKKLVLQKQKELKKTKGKKPIKKTGKSVSSKPKTISNSKAAKIVKKQTPTAPKYVTSEKLSWKAVDIPDTLDDYEGFCGLEEIEGVDVKIVNGRAQFIVKSDDKVRSQEEIKSVKTSIPEGDFELDEEDVNEDELKKSEEDHEEGDEDEDNKEDGEEEDKEVEQGEENEENEKANNEKLSSEKMKIIEKEPSKNKKKTKTVTTLTSRNNADDEQDVPTIETEQTPEEIKPKVQKPKQNIKKLQEDELLANGDAFTAAQELELPDDNINLPKWTKPIPQLSAFTLTGLSKLGFNKPTEIQKKTIPVALEGTDVIGKAITGSGKTLAYGIPIMEKAISTGNWETQDTPTGIIFAPTRELASQVSKHLQQLIKYSSLPTNSIVTLTGGLSIQKQERLLGYNPRIIIATPGRFLELIEKSTDTATKFASTDIVVFDEADRLLQDGHFEELDKILELLNNYRPKEKLQSKKWQSLVFSATFSKDLFGKLDSTKPKPEAKNNKKRKANEVEESGDAETAEVLQMLGKKLRFRSKPSFIDVNPTDVVADKIIEAMIPCGNQERDLMFKD